MNFRRIRAQPAAAAPAAVSLQPIGVVHNSVPEPRPHGWEVVESTIVIRAGLDPAVLGGLSEFSHILVVFWFDRLGADRPRPATLAIGSANPGILATRSQLRPAPIGVSAVRLTRIEGATLRVVGLDATDGTPVLDVKPYIPYYDSIPDAAVPSWVLGGRQ